MPNGFAGTAFSFYYLLISGYGVLSVKSEGEFGMRHHVLVPMTVLTLATGTVAHPLWFVKKYSCGDYYGFITRVALRGRFKTENSAV